MVVRLLIADSSTMVRLGYAAAVAGQTDLVLAGGAGTAAEARTLLAAARPDVVVLEATLPDQPVAGPIESTDPRSAGGLRLGRQIRAEQPDLGVIMVGPPDDELLFRALEERFSAYLPRHAPVDVLLSAIRHAAVAPAAFTAPDLAAALGRRRAASVALSPREIEVLRHLHGGANNAKIAASMRLTESTVRTYLARVYDKLGVRSRTQALVAATERGLIG
jgi:DNA-binding NarL/FixJ family response regulator